MKIKFFSVAAMTSVMCASVGALPASAQPPRVRHADVDYEASGFVMPAGATMSPEAMMAGAMQVGAFSPAAGGCTSCGDHSGSSVGMSSPMMYGSPMMHGSAMMHRGEYYGGGYGGCNTCGGACGGCGDTGCLLGGGGLLGKLHSENGFFGYRLMDRHALGQAFSRLLPYSEAGRCSQRWYDLSAEALFLGRTTSSIGPSVITKLGADPGGIPVITAGDGIKDGLEDGVRLSAAVIFGVGGNLEVIYMGGHEWDEVATATSPAEFTPDGLGGFTLTGGANLFSFLSEFGTDPVGGFDDTDNSVSQTFSSSSNFHSGEWNYRRRTVGPECWLQSSWLVGMRYFRYDNRLGLNIQGVNDAGPDALPAEFFIGNESVKNDLFGAQIGGDLWWNLVPGVGLGVELKGAWLNNEITAESSYAANSIDDGAPGSFADERDDSDGTLALEFQAIATYRISHSWNLRSAYYLIAIDDVATPQFDRDFILDSAVAGTAVGNPGRHFDSVTLSGFSFGAEYTW